MRAPLIGAACLAAAVIVEAFAAPASNFAHVCGDKRLSSADQMDCRSQMDAAKTESERLRIQGNFEKLSASVAGEASTNARRNPPLKTTAPTPQTNPSGKPSDSYPPSEAKPPVYPGDIPNPKTGEPPA